jgi:hypothetical protein
MAQAGEVAGQPAGDQDLDQGAQGTDDTSGSGEEEVDWKSEAEKWRGLSRKHEQASKQNASAARRLKELEDKDKTELQLAQEQLAEAQQSARDSQENHWRMMAAAMNDLPVEMIDLLGTGTEEEINERAEAMAQVINTKATEIAKRTVEAMGLSWNGESGSGNYSSTAQGAFLAGTAGRPVESMRAGAAPGQGGAPRTMEEVFRNMVSGDTD